jgi:crotonobetainyl-CoA:carnitine CoA-transferase CaiB-like acyl-CoA transferase
MERITVADKSAAVWPDRHDRATGPLRGVRVLDLTTVVMGPSATQILGDLGADVVKVETQTGDTMRLIGPWRHEGMGPLFLQSNRNKRASFLTLRRRKASRPSFG